MNNKNITVKQSRISGKGVFANRDFRKGEIVLRWHPKEIKSDDMQKFPKRELHFIEKVGRKLYLMQPPERYVNHSCDANTSSRKNCDIARRDIKKGEEVTANYFGHELIPFKCRCGGKHCKKIIK